MTEYIYEHVPSGDDATGNPVEAPTLVQREEIVRCRDCRYYAHNSFHRCDLYAIAHEIEPNGFCSWGKRKVDG